MGVNTNICQITCPEEMAIVKNAKIIPDLYPRFYEEKAYKDYVGYTGSESSSELQRKYNEFFESVEEQEFIVLKYGYTNSECNKDIDVWFKIILPKQDKPGHWCLTQNPLWYGTNFVASEAQGTKSKIVYVADDGTVTDLSGRNDCLFYLLTASITNPSYKYGSSFYVDKFVLRGTNSYNKTGSYYGWCYDGFPINKYAPENIELGWRFYKRGSYTFTVPDFSRDDVVFIYSNIDIGIYDTTTKKIGYYIRDITDSNLNQQFIDRVGLPEPQTDYLKGRYIVGYSLCMNAFYAIFAASNYSRGSGSYVYLTVNDVNEFAWRRPNTGLWAIDPASDNNLLSDVTLEIYILGSDSNGNPVWTQIRKAVDEEVANSNRGLYRFPCDRHPVVFKSTYKLYYYEFCYVEDPDVLPRTYEWHQESYGTDVSKLIFDPEGASDDEPDFIVPDDFTPDVEESGNDVLDKAFGIIKNGHAISEIMCHKIPLSKIVIGSKTIWSSASVITYLLNGVKYTREIMYGENAVNTDISFNIPGAKFIGWTTDKNSQKPMSYIPASEDLMIYAIWKYNDATLVSSDKTVSWELMYSGRDVSKKFVDIDGKKYGSITAKVSWNPDVAKYNTANNVRLYLGVDGNIQESYVGVVSQSGGIVWDPEKGESVDKSWTNWANQYQGGQTHTITVPNKNSNIYARLVGEAYKATATLNSLTAVGRTIVG